MAPPNRVLLPGTIDQELGDIRRQIHALNTAGATPQPLTYSESVDNAHPMSVDFVLPAGIQSASCKLSFKFRPFRSTSSSAGGATGAESAVHSHGHSHTSAAEAAHSHASAAHLHDTPVGVVVAGVAVTLAGVGAHGMLWEGAGLAGTIDSNSTTPGSTGSTTPGTPGNTGSDASNESATHTHSVGGSSLGVSEGTSTTISALAVDGVDKTSLLGGPWTVDTIDLDLTAVLPLGDGAWHAVTLTPAGQGRVVAVLRLA